MILHGFFAILVVRGGMAVAFALGMLASTALMAVLVPRSTRGKMMAAIGQGGIMLGAVGNPGGPAVGYLFIPLVMIASLGSGFLYTLYPTYPWIAATTAGALSIILTIWHIRDPKQAEI